MALRINMNVAALNAHRQLQGTDNALGSSIEKLSSGFKINRAADSPSGLAISEGLRAQISGLGQAISNSNDAVNMIKTAEGAMAEIHSLLRTMRDLAVHAAQTGSNDTAALAADQAQVTETLATLTNIANNTAFGNKKLLDGTATGMIFQIGANAGETIAVSIKSTKTDAIDVSGPVASGLNAKLTSVTLGSATNLTTDAIGVVQALHVTSIGALATHTGGGAAYADVDATVRTAGTITINDRELTFNGTEDITAVLLAINNDSANNVVATFADGKVVLTQDTKGSNQAITYSETADVINGGADNNYIAYGTNAQAHVVDPALREVTFDQGYGLTLESAAGDQILLGGTAVVEDLAAAFTMTGTTAGEAALKNVDDVNVTTDADGAITTLTSAISRVSTMRAELGAKMLSLQSNMSSLGVAKENIAASESAIRDVDMAAEMVNFTRNQILMQAGIAMLAQANSAPQSLLQLMQ